MHHHLRVVAGIGAVLMALTLTTACGSQGTSASTAGSSSSSQDQGPITLNFLHSSNADPTWQKAIDSFQAAHPNVTIKEQQTSFDDLNSQIQARLSAKDNTIDVYSVDGPRLANNAAQGFLLDLSDYKSQILSQTDQTSLDEVTYDGKQYAFPQWTSTGVMYYNKTLLANAGLSDPSADPSARMTWEDLLTNAQKAQDAGAKYGFGFEQVDRYYQLQPLFESAGGGSGLSGDGNLTPDITNAQWQTTATWYGNLFANGLSPRGIPVEQMPDQFAQGNIAYFVGGPWCTSSFGSTNFDWGVAPMPSFAGGKAVTPSGSWLIGVSPFSQHPDIATQFAEWITLDPTGSAQVNPEGIPIQKDSLSSYLANLSNTPGWGNDMANIIKYELANTAVMRPVSVGYVDFETIMNNAFADIRNGQDPATTLQDASDQITSTFARYN